MSIKADSVEGVSFPSIKDRVIEKVGHVITFTLNQIEENTKLLLRSKTEITAKKDLENSKAVNIEGFHPFVKELSEEQLFTAWMYHESKTKVKLCTDKLEEIETQMAEDIKEVEEIKKQIPQLDVSEVVQESTEIINEKE